jgi:hypothetical protein
MTKNAEQGIGDTNKPEEIFFGRSPNKKMLFFLLFTYNIYQWEIS